MKKLVNSIFAVACCLTFPATAQQSCLTDSITIITDTNWTIVSNSLGAPSNVPATIVSSQYNSILGFPAAKWISAISSWTINTSTTAPDDSIHYRYQFRSCTPDTAHLSFLVRRDNYCHVYLDGALLMSDPVVYDMNYINIGDIIDTVIALDSGDHSIDVILYNRNSFNGANGVGLLMAGYITTVDSSLIVNNSICDTFTCWSNTYVTQITSGAASIKMYPNPATDEVSIELLNTIGYRDYTLYDITGKVMQQAKLNHTGTNRLNVSGLPTGTYLLRVEGISKVYKLEKR